MNSNSTFAEPNWLIGFFRLRVEDFNRVGRLRCGGSLQSPEPDNLKP